MPAQKKKMLILAILGILRDHTDADHRIRQAAIMKLLEQEYQLTATRKSVRKNLADLQEAGYPVVFRKGWFYAPLLESAELDFLQQCVMGSNIPAGQREDLLRRMDTLGGPFHRAGDAIGKVRPTNPQFLYTVDVLQSAIASGTQVSFKYGNYDVDKELHPRTDEEGKAKLYKINPYRLATVNGRCYLICNVDKYDTLCHFRVDRIIDVKKLRAPAKPLERIADATDTLSTEQYISEHPYMYTGKPVKTRIEVDRAYINDVLDWFGMGVAFDKVTETTAQAVIVADPKSVEFWLRRYGDHARLV